METAIKILRETNNYTQKFIAEDILGITQNTYSRLERSPSKLTAEQGKKLADFYNVTIDNLLSGISPRITFNDNELPFVIIIQMNCYY